MNTLKNTILVHHPTDTLEYARLASERLPDVEFIPCPTLADIEALIPRVEIIFGWRMPPRCFALANNLRWLQGMGAGIEDLMANRDLADNVMITRVSGIFGPWIAEYTLAHILAWTQDIRRSLANQGVRKWDKFLVRKARGLRLGVAGLGSVGQEVARLALAAGLQVSGLDLEDKTLPDGSRAFRGSRGSPELHRFLSDLDVLSINLPLTPETEKMFGAAELAAMPSGAYIVNTARGRIIDTDAFVAAVASGHLGGAALDVFETEPLAQESPLWGLPGVTVTSHISGPSTPAEVVPIFVENYRRYLAGEPLVGLVDRARGF
jgi:glyoxylate/hydroxypyruvate reductase A